MLFPEETSQSPRRKPVLSSAPSAVRKAEMVACDDILAAIGSPDDVPARKFATVEDARSSLELQLPEENAAAQQRAEQETEDEWRKLVLVKQEAEEEEEEEGHELDDQKKKEEEEEEEEAEELSDVELSSLDVELEPEEMGKELFRMQHDHIGAGSLVGEKTAMRVDDVAFASPFGQQIGGTFILTNFRALFVPEVQARDKICFPQGFFSIPLTLVEKIEKTKKSKDESAVGIALFCRDVRQLNFLFHKSIRDKAFDCLNSFCFPLAVKQYFAFDHAKGLRKLNVKFPEALDGWNLYDPVLEFERLGLFSPENHNMYIVSDVNSKYSICPTYPRFLALPRGIFGREIQKIAAFRSKGRIPTLIWKHPKHMSSMWRCSQPKVGLNTTRCAEDEKLFQLIADLNPSGGKVKIIDARPRLNAVGNRFTGAGYEHSEYYIMCDLDFMNIQNIHVVRDSYQKLAKAAWKGSSVGSNPSTQQNWFSMLENSSWLSHISEIIKATVISVSLVDEQRATVVTHCSDGWDRTSQIVSLAELCLDPYFRTIRGFCILIEKEWLSFGHKFHQRLSLGCQNSGDQRSPIFLQWLECVWQLSEQFPSAFEFNGQFLLRLYDIILSCRFGTFLLNSQHDRESLEVFTQTLSVWTYFFTCKNRAQFVNPFYVPCCASDSNVLYPAYSLNRLRLWEDYWFRYTLTDNVQGRGVKTSPDHASLSIEAQARRLKHRYRKVERENQALWRFLESRTDLLRESDLLSLFHHRVLVPENSDRDPVADHPPHSRRSSTLETALIEHQDGELMPNEPLPDDVDDTETV